MSTRLIAWRDEGIWTWASLYLLEHKEQYLECKTTRNNRLKGKFYRDLYDAYSKRPRCASDSASTARTSRSLRDLISDRGKLCRYIHELADMRNKKMDLSWVSRRLLKNLDALLKIIPRPKGGKIEAQTGSSDSEDGDYSRSKQMTRHRSDGWIDVTSIPTPPNYQMLISLPEGTVLKTSASCKPMLGYDMVGMHFSGTLCGKNEAPGVLQRISCAALKKQGSPATKIPMLYRRRSSNHTYIWIESYCQVVKTDIAADRTMKSIVCIIERDVTDAVCWGQNKRAAEAANRMRLSGAATPPSTTDVPPPIMPEHLSPTNIPQHRYGHVKSEQSGPVAQAPSRQQRKSPTVAQSLPHPMNRELSEDQQQRLSVPIPVNPAHQQKPNQPQHRKLSSSVPGHVNPSWLPVPNGVKHESLNEQWLSLNTPPHFYSPTKPPLIERFPDGYPRPNALFQSIRSPSPEIPHSHVKQLMGVYSMGTGVRIPTDDELSAGSKSSSPSPHHRHEDGLEEPAAKRQRICKQGFREFGSPNTIMFPMGAGLARLAESGRE